ncbi:MAG TPA: LytTR family DNA-binding domain-containing protein [Chitinophagaceae bacterium]
MRCVIVDDEPNAIEILQRYASRVDLLETAATFRDPAKAVHLLNSEKIELLFIDINMPELTGMQLLALLSYKPLVIFTTAYPEYAVESYDYNAIDYLVKPISFERFLKAVNKAITQAELLSKSEQANAMQEPENKEVILLKSGTLLHRVNKSEILYFEKDSNYIIVHTADKKILVRGNMQDVFEWVSPAEFFQLHKSFIVNLGKIETIEVHQVTIKGRKVPVGSTYRDAFLSRITG